MTFAGCPVELSVHAVTRTWVYPTERFWKYVPSKETEDWCRFFGYGYERVDPAVFEVNTAGRRFYVMHPSIWEQLKKEVGR